MKIGTERVRFASSFCYYLKIKMINLYLVLSLHGSDLLAGDLLQLISTSKQTESQDYRTN